MYRLGIDVGGTNIAAGILDDQYKLMGKLSAKTPIGSAEQAANVIFDLSMMLSGKTNIGIDEIEGIGIAVPGTIDADGKTVIRAVNLGLWNSPLKEIVSQRFYGKKTHLINDADAATLAEVELGSLKGVSTGLLITIGTGIGGAFVFGGKLFKGGLNRGTEIGHAVFNQAGDKCSCGNIGCFETIASASVLKKAAESACRNKRGMIYSRSLSGQLPDAKLLIDCAEAGDVYALSAFDDYIEGFSNVLASIVNMLDPQVIALGGGVSAAGEFLLAPLRQRTAQKCFFGSCGRIVCASAGNDAGIFGAAMALSE